MNWGFILQLFSVYGWEVMLTAFAVIFLVGVVKVLFKKGFDSIGKDAAKPVYETLSLLFAFGLSFLWMYFRTAWFGVEGPEFSWEAYSIEASTVYALIKIIYPIYEAYGLRGLVKAIGKVFKSMFVKDVKIEAPEIQAPDDGRSKVIEL